MLGTRKNKKGLALEFVVGAVIALLVFLTIFSVIKLFSGKGEQAADFATCRLKLEKAAMSKIAGITLTEDTECRTHKVNVIAPGEEKAKKGIVVKNEKELAAIIRDEMAGCWKSHGEGKLDYVTDWGGPNADTYCSICSYIQISNRITLGSINNFQKYLDEKMNGLSYKDYFSKDGALYYTDKLRGEINIPVENLVVVYALKKTISFDAGLLGKIGRGAIIGGIGGAALGPKGVAAGALIGTVTTFVGKQDNMYVFMPVVPLKDLGKDLSGCKLI